jgi:spore coat protein CotH
MELTKVPVNRWLDNENVVHTLFSHKKSEILSFLDNMDGTNGHYFQWHKPDTEKINSICSYTYVEAKKVDLMGKGRINVRKGIGEKE